MARPDMFEIFMELYARFHEIYGEAESLYDQKVKTEEFLAERGWTLQELLDELSKEDPEAARSCPFFEVMN